MNAERLAALRSAGIFRICQLLHQHATGASDPLHELTRKQYVEYLQLRLINWEQSMPRSSAVYDGAVRNLIHITLEEQYEYQRTSG